MKKKYWFDALKRGMVGVTIGLPVSLIIFLVIYLIIKYTTGGQDNLEMNTMYYAFRLVASFYITCFIFAASTEVYKIEELPIKYAILIHFSCIFICWFSCAALANWIDVTNWISWIIAIGSFIVVYIIVLSIIFAVNKRRVKMINEKLNK